MMSAKDCKEPKRNAFLCRGIFDAQMVFGDFPGGFSCDATYSLFRYLQKKNVYKQFLLAQKGSLRVLLTE